MTNATETVEVEHNGETIEVPKTFDYNDYAAYFGSVPDEFEADRIFVYEGSVRVEAFLGDGEWVEAIYQTDESAPVFNASEHGWVVQKVDANPPEDEAEIGKTIWTRGE